MKIAELLISHGAKINAKDKACNLMLGTNHLLGKLIMVSIYLKVRVSVTSCYWFY